MSQISAIRVEKNPQGILSRALKATQLAWRIDTDLSTWYAEVVASTRGPLYIPELSQLSDVTGGINQAKLFPVSFNFSHFAVGQVMGLYWTALTILYTFFESMYQKLGRMADGAARAQADPLPCSCGGGGDRNVVEIDAGQEGPAEVRDCMRHFRIDMLPPLHHRGNPKVVADNVCQSVEYFLRMDSGYVGSTIVLPMIMAVRNCMMGWETDTTREREWIRQAIGMMACIGNRLVRHINAYQE